MIFSQFDKKVEHFYFTIKDEFCKGHEYVLFEYEKFLQFTSFKNKILTNVDSERRLELFSLYKISNEESS